jgi:hypothetical protein
VAGVGHEPEALSDVERADARSAQINRPDGVVRCLQISRNTIEPSKSIRARNLFTKDDCRAALADEAEPRRPKVARIIGAIALPRSRERLTGTASCPDSTIVAPAGESKGKRPAANAGEEMALDEPAHIGCGNVFDVPFVNFAISYQARLNQFSQPLSRECVDLVVIRCHRPLMTSA